MDFFSTVKGQQLADALTRYCNMKVEENHMKQFYTVVHVADPDPMTEFLEMRKLGYSPEEISEGINSESLTDVVKDILGHGGRIDQIIPFHCSKKGNALLILYTAKTERSKW